MSFIVAADTGGTFTDLAAFDSERGRIIYAKSLTTHDDLVEGVMDCIRKVDINLAEASVVKFGTTLVINTFVERTGAKTALLTTEGFRDSLEIGRGNRPIPFDFRYKRHPVLVERDLRFEISERVSADGSVTRAAPWVELRAAPAISTTRDVFEFLGHTDATAQASVNGIGTKVYATGVFFDSVALVEGPNRVRLEARWPHGGGVAVYEDEFERRIAPPRPALPLWIDADSVEPSDTLALLPSDNLRLSFRGSAGQQATARIRPGNLEIPFFQRSDDDGSASYAADLQLSRLQPGRSYEVEIRLRQADGGNRIRHRLEHPIEVREPHDFPLLVTSARESYLSWSLGWVRLGGPYAAEFPEGVVLQANGIFGRRYRVMTNSSPDSAWSKHSSRCGSSSGNRGITRDSPPG